MVTSGGLTFNVWVCSECKCLHPSVPDKWGKYHCPSCGSYGAYDMEVIPRLALYVWQEVKR